MRSSRFFYTPGHLGAAVAMLGRMDDARINIFSNMIESLKSLLYKRIRKLNLYYLAST
jgi:hypothetical protein